MHFSYLSLSLLVLIFLTSSIESERVADRIYVTFPRARYCVRHLNGTHEIGCQSAESGNSGRMHMIDNNEDLQYFLQNSQLIEQFSSFILFLNIDLFNITHIDQLMTRLDSKLNGLLIYLKSNLTRPKDFSSDDSCPNHRYSYYLPQIETINWNSKGSALYFRSFPFPIMLIDESDDYQTLVDFYQKFNSSTSTLACGLELSTFQNAADSTRTCLRRSDISHSLIDAATVHCDPVNGLNIYSKLPQSLTITPNKRPLKSVILILTTTDSFQMFLKTNGPTGGAQQPATGLLILFTLAHLIGQEQEHFNQQNKEFIFLTLDGDALDYSGSFRFLYDIENGFFPSGNSNEERIKVEHIHSIIEFQSLSYAQDLSLFAYPSSLINQTFLNQTIENNPTIHLISSNSSLPPASSQIFLRQTNSSHFPAYIFTSTNQNQLSNHYYHSFFDDPSTLGINLTSLEFDTTTDFSRWIKNFTESFAQTLIQSFVGVTKNMTIEQTIVNNLVYCVLKNINCPLIQNITNQTTAKSFQPFDQVSLPFSVNTYPISTTPTFPFVQSILSYFLRDRSYDRLNLTETQCKTLANNDSFCSYNYVPGYFLSVQIDQSVSGYCVRSYLQAVDSRSPAFVIENYDFTQTTYPQWTESRWSTMRLRLFVTPTRQHEVITFVVGLLLLFISFLTFFLLRIFTKISLLQPSSS